ncbi:hypothetical protein WJX74_000447 [Apatococcus lobatus]|uniref:Methyltransferase type 11 domain-containing protein n=1 Tax=Apatococcus lobatus TaxID=904363 RepID=A0AAW1QUW8_9CHLO
MTTLLWAGSFNLLDVASGPGEPGIPFAHAFEMATITLSDFSPDLCNIAQSRVTEEHLTERVSVKVVDAQDMSCFPDASFGVVTSAFGIFMIPDPAKALREVHRVLKPGGHFGFTVWGPVGRMHFQRFIFDICQEVFPPATSAAPPPTDLPKWTDKQIPLAALIEAGFCQAALQVFDVPMAFTSWQHFEAFVFDNPGCAALFKSDGASKRQQASDLMTHKAKAEGILVEDGRIFIQQNEAHFYTANKPGMPLLSPLNGMRPSPLSLRLRDALTVDDRLDLSASSPGLLSTSSSTDNLWNGREQLFPFLPSPAASENAESSPVGAARPLSKAWSDTELRDSQDMALQPINLNSPHLRAAQTPAPQQPRQSSTSTASAAQAAAQASDPAPLALSDSPQFHMQHERRGFRASAGAASFNPRRQSTAIFKTMDLASAGQGLLDAEDLLALESGIAPSSRRLTSTLLTPLPELDDLPWEAEGQRDSHPSTTLRYNAADNSTSSPPAMGNAPAKTPAGEPRNANQVDGPSSASAGALPSTKDAACSPIAPPTANLDVAHADHLMSRSAGALPSREDTSGSPAASPTATLRFAIEDDALLLSSPDPKPTPAESITLPGEVPVASSTIAVMGTPLGTHAQGVDAGLEDSFEQAAAESSPAERDESFHGSNGSAVSTDVPPTPTPTPAVSAALPEEPQAVPSSTGAVDVMPAAACSEASDASMEDSNAGAATSTRDASLGDGIAVSLGSSVNSDHAQTSMGQTAGDSAGAAETMHSTEQAVHTEAASQPSAFSAQISSPSLLHAAISSETKQNDDTAGAAGALPSNDRPSHAGTISEKLTTRCMSMQGTHNHQPGQVADLDSSEKPAHADNAGNTSHDHPAGTAQPPSNSKRDQANAEAASSILGKPAMTNSKPHGARIPFAPTQTQAEDGRDGACMPDADHAAAPGGTDAEYKKTTPGNRSASESSAVLLEASDDATSAAGLNRVAPASRMIRMEAQGTDSATGDCQGAAADACDAQDPAAAAAAAEAAASIDGSVAVLCEAHPRSLFTAAEDPVINDSSALDRNPNRAPAENEQGAAQAHQPIEASSADPLKPAAEAAESIHADVSSGPASETGGRPHAAVAEALEAHQKLCASDRVQAGTAQGADSAPQIHRGAALEAEGHRSRDAAAPQQVSTSAEPCVVQLSKAKSAPSSAEQVRPSSGASHSHDGAACASARQGQDASSMIDVCTSMADHQPAMPSTPSASALSCQGINSAGAASVTAMQGLVSSLPKAVSQVDQQHAEEAAQAAAGAPDAEGDTATAPVIVLKAAAGDLLTAARSHEIGPAEEAVAAEMAASALPPTAAESHVMEAQEEAVAAVTAAYGEETAAADMEAPEEAPTGAGKAARPGPPAAGESMDINDSKEESTAPEAVAAIGAGVRNPKSLAADGQVAALHERQDSSDSWQDSSSSSEVASSPGAAASCGQDFPASSKDGSSVDDKASASNLISHNSAVTDLGETGTAVPLHQVSDAEYTTPGPAGMHTNSSHVPAGAATDGLPDTNQQLPAPRGAEDLFLPGMSDSPPGSPTAGRRSPSWKRRSSSPDKQARLPSEDASVLQSAEMPGLDKSSPAGADPPPDDSYPTGFRPMNMSLEPQVQPAGIRDSMALFLQLEEAVTSTGSLTPEQILDLRASAAHLNVSGARPWQNGQLTRASLRQDLKASMSRLRASSSRGSSRLSGDAMRESLSLFLALEGDRSEDGDPEEVMWLTDGLPSTPQATPYSSGPAPDTVPMPTIAEEEGSPDKFAPSRATGATLPSQAAIPHAAATASDQQSAAYNAVKVNPEPGDHDVSLSFSFKPSTLLHMRQEAAPAADRHLSASQVSEHGIYSPLFGERSNSSSSTNDVPAQEQSESATMKLPQTRDLGGTIMGQSAAHEDIQASSRDMTSDGPRALKPPTLRQPYPAATLIGSIEGLEHVGLEPLPSGGTSPDTTAAPRSRLGPSSSERLTRDESFDGSRIPRLAFPGFSAGVSNESQDQSLTSSTPKFSPKQHFNELDLRKSHPEANSYLTPQQLDLVKSTELPIRHSDASCREHNISSSGIPQPDFVGKCIRPESQALPMGDPSRHPVRHTGGPLLPSSGGPNDFEPSFQWPSSPQQLQSRGNDQADAIVNLTEVPQRPQSPTQHVSAGGDGGSPVGRKSLEARRESMLRALSGSSRSSSGDLSSCFSGSLQPQLLAAEPPAIPASLAGAQPLNRSSSGSTRQQDPSHLKLPLQNTPGNEEGLHNAHAHLEQGAASKQPARQSAGSLLQQLPKQPLRQSQRGASGRQISENSKASSSNSGRPGLQADSLSSLQKASARAVHPAKGSETTSDASKASEAAGGPSRLQPSRLRRPTGASRFFGGTAPPAAASRAPEAASEGTRRPSSRPKESPSAAAAQPSRANTTIGAANKAGLQSSTTSQRPARAGAAPDPPILGTSQGSQVPRVSHAKAAVAAGFQKRAGPSSLAAAPDGAPSHDARMRSAAGVPRTSGLQSDGAPSSRARAAVAVGFQRPTSLPQRQPSDGTASRIPGARAGASTSGTQIPAAHAAGHAPSATSSSRGRSAQAASHPAAHQAERLKRAASAEHKLPSTTAARQLPAEGPLGSSRTGLSSLRNPTPTSRALQSSSALPQPGLAEKAGSRAPSRAVKTSSTIASSASGQHTSAGADSAASASGSHPSRQVPAAPVFSWQRPKAAAAVAASAAQAATPPPPAAATPGAHTGHTPDRLAELLSNPELAFQGKAKLFSSPGVQQMRKEQQNKRKTAQERHWESYEDLEQ